MTDATPLASEQIMRIALESVTPSIVAAFADDPCLIWSGEWRAYWRNLGQGYTKSALEAGRFTIAGAYACTKHCDPSKQIMFERAALSASPAPSGQGVSGEVLLHDHVRKMQEACANYIEPATYIARHPDTSKIGDCAWVREFPMPDQHASAQGAAETNTRRDQAFIRDIIYMLDGPEQRAAMSAAPAPSDQDASQAQGEVTKADRDLYARLCPDMCSLIYGGDLDQFGEMQAIVAFRKDAALSSAPGATAQDGVERAARALCVADGLDPDEHIIGGQATGFEDFGPLWQAEERSEGQLGLTNYKRLALAALNAPTGAA